MGEPWKSSVLRCYDGPGCDCLVCKFIEGDRSAECLEEVVRVLDEQLAQSEKDLRELLKCVVKMKDERHAD